MLDIIYAETKMRALSEPQPAGNTRRFRAHPDAEIPRTGVGRVHEVFRRIAEGERPVRAAPERRWRPSFAGRR